MQASDQVQQCGFAATGGPDDANEFSGLTLRSMPVQSQQALPWLVL